MSPTISFWAISVVRFSLSWGHDISKCHKLISLMKKFWMSKALLWQLMFKWVQHELSIYTAFVSSLHRIISLTIVNTEKAEAVTLTWILVTLLWTSICNIPSMPCCNNQLVGGGEEHYVLQVSTITGTYSVLSTMFCEEASDKVKSAVLYVFSTCISLCNDVALL